MLCREIYCVYKRGTLESILAKRYYIWYKKRQNACLQRHNNVVNRKLCTKTATHRWKARCVYRDGSDWVKTKAGSAKI